MIAQLLLIMILKRILKNSELAHLLPWTHAYKQKSSTQQEAFREGGFESEHTAKTNSQVYKNNNQIIIRCQSTSLESPSVYLTYRLGYAYRKIINLNKFQGFAQKVIDPNSVKTNWQDTKPNNNLDNKSHKSFSKVAQLNNLQQNSKKVNQDGSDRSSNKRVRSAGKDIHYNLDGKGQFKQTKQQHQINTLIKRAAKISELYHIVKKYANRLSMVQLINLFDKFAYFQKTTHQPSAGNGKAMDKTNEVKIQQKYDQLFSGLNRQLFKTAHAPEIYVRFLHIFSKCQNQHVFNNYFDNSFMKIIREQLYFEPIHNTAELEQTQINSRELGNRGQVSDQQANRKDKINQINGGHIKKQADKQEKLANISEVMSIQANIRLAQTLLRIFNHKICPSPNSHRVIPQKYKEQAKLILALLKQVISYLHTPVTPDRVQTKLLFRFISQYMKVYPHIKLGNMILKSLVRQGLTRVKYENTLKKVKDTAKIQMQQNQEKSRSRDNQKDRQSWLKRKQQSEGNPKVRIQKIQGLVEEENEQEQQFKVEQCTQTMIVNSIKKLLILEELLIQQSRTSSMHKQILETRQNNIQHNLFYKVQYKINKYIGQLLHRCKFHKQIGKHQGKGTPKQVQTLWQHAQLIPMLAKHVKLLILQTPIQILSKCQLLTASYSQYESISSYLYNLYSYLVDISLGRVNSSVIFPSGSSRSGNSDDLVQSRSSQINLSKMLGDSYSLLYVVLDQSVQMGIPSAIVDKAVNKRLVNMMIKQFNSLTNQIKVIVIWYLIDRKTRTELTKSKSDALNKSSSWHHRTQQKSTSNSVLNTENQQVSRPQDKLVGQLIKYLVSNSGECGSLRKGKYNTEMGYWYTRLLCGNPRFMQIVEEQGIVQKQRQFADICYKSIISDMDTFVQNYIQLGIYHSPFSQVSGTHQSRSRSAENSQQNQTKTIVSILQHTAATIAKHICRPHTFRVSQSSTESKEISSQIVKSELNQLLKFNDKKSINNCMLNESQIGLLKQRDAYSRTDSGKGVMVGAQMQKLEQIIVNRIDKCMYRTYLISKIIDNCTKERGQHGEIVGELARTYRREYMLLNHKRLLEHRHKQIHSLILELVKGQDEQHGLNPLMK